MKTSILIFLSIFFSEAVFCQTKLIAHKSHSGTSESFSKALGNDDFGLQNSNFGLPTFDYQYNTRIDSLIYNEDGSVTIVTSVHENQLEQSGTKSAERTTVREPYLFGNQILHERHSLDSIKKVLKSEFHFKNDIEKVVFIGYDNGRSDTKNSEENSILPFSIHIGDRLFLIGACVIGSILIISISLLRRKCLRI